MTDGPAPSAESPHDSSGSIPTASPPTEIFPISVGSLSALLAEAFREGYEMGAKLRLLPLPPITFDVAIDRETERVEVFSRLL